MSRQPCFTLSATPFTGRTLTTSPTCSRRLHRSLSVRRVYAKVVEPGSEPEGKNAVDDDLPPVLDESDTPESPATDDIPLVDEEGFESQVPGKIKLDELTIARQKTELDNYSAELRRKRLQEEREAARLFGFVPYAETLNGRLAMFFIITGLLTEYWTGYTIPEQVELMLRTLGII